MTTRSDAFDDFLPDHEPPPRSWSLPEGVDGGFEPVDLFLGRGDNPIEIACATWTRSDAPSPTKLRALWAKRHGGAASPLLLLVAYATSDEGVCVAACGPVGDQPPVEIGLDLSQAERIAGAALVEPSRHFAIRFLSAVLPEIGGDLVGLRNQGMLPRVER